MSELVARLLETASVKDYAKAFKDCQNEISAPREMTLQVLRSVAFRFYEYHYDIRVPLAPFGLAAAWTASGLYPEERKWWPFVQQTWALVIEPKRKVYDFKDSENGSGVDPGETFSASARMKDFDSAFAAARALLKTDAGRRDLRTRTLAAALETTFLAGLPLAQVAQSWRLAEALGWESAEQILFPALHLLVKSPSDGSEPERWIPDSQTGETLQGNTGELTETLHQEIEETLLFGDLSAAPRTLRKLADAGVGLEGAMESLLLSAAQGLTNARSGHWIQPARALIHTYLSTKVLQPPQSIRALGFASRLIHEASRSSSEKGQNRDIEDVTSSFCPTGEFTTLRDLVSHSDPYASVISARTILAMGEPRSALLFPALATLAAKNDPRVASGHDLLIVEACADSYQKARTAHKLKLVDACSFFLGRIKKDYDLFNAYGV